MSLADQIELSRGEKDSKTGVILFLIYILALLDSGIETFCHQLCFSYSQLTSRTNQNDIFQLMSPGIVHRAGCVHDGDGLADGVASRW